MCTYGRGTCLVEFTTYILYIQNIYGTYDNVQGTSSGGEQPQQGRSRQAIRGLLCRYSAGTTDGRLFYNNVIECRRFFDDTQDALNWT